MGILQVRRWGSLAGRTVLGRVGNRIGHADNVPDLLLDFATGGGIPLTNGGAGGRGSELVQIISPQDAGGGARLVRAPRYWDPTAEWQAGEPIFASKQPNRLVGWPGPRTGGYWTGPMANRSSTSETVAVYWSTTGLTVTTVAGGVVGPQAIRCDVAAGQNGDGWAVWPTVSMTSGWSVDANGNGTVAYVHAVVELLGNVSDHQFWAMLFDHGTSGIIDLVVQHYNASNQLRVGKFFRGVGPHGGQLYEIWALVRLTSTPVGPIAAYAYLLSSGSGSNPERTVIVHGCQMYMVPRFDQTGIVGLPPFFSHARGTAVVWTSENLRINTADVAYSAALKARASQFTVGATNCFADIVARNGSNSETWYHRSANGWRAASPNAEFPGFDSRVAFRVGGDYSRAASVDGNTVVSGGTFDSPPTPSYLEIGRGDGGTFFGRLARLALWRRALSDAELLKAFLTLGAPLP
jgi:hypothetical protein